MRTIHRLLWTSAFLALGSCTTVGTDYTAPELPTPDAWAIDLAGAQDSDPAVLATWWTQLGDPYLSDLVTRALEGNKDIAVSLSRVNEARALRGMARSRLFPNIDLGGNATRSRGLGGGPEVDSWQTSVDMSWELDLVGGVRRALEASDADLGALHETLRDVRVLIAAEVASTYVEVRNFQARLRIAEDNIKTQRQSMKLAKDRFDQGASSALDTAQAESNLATTEANVPALAAGLRRSMHRLGVLLGQSPSSLYAELEDYAPVPKITESLPIGIPANLLRQRPDLRSAERQLAAQTARVGVAEADLYPRFFLPGSAGLGAVRDQPFTSSDTSGFWNLGIGFSWNLFDFGGVQRNIDVQEERVQQALVNYESTLLRALEEVENALITFSKEGLRRNALARAVAATQRAADMSNQRYTEGVDDFQKVLDAERSLFAVQDALQVSEADHVRALISVYLALGGGWQVPEGE